METVSTDGTTFSGQAQFEFEGSANVQVRLNFDSDGNNVCNGQNEVFNDTTTLTDANDFYLFENLPPDGYCLAWGEPDGFECTDEDVKDNAFDTIDSDGRDMGRNCRLQNVSLIDLQPGEDDRTWDLGLVRPVSSLSDRVWEDLNCGLFLDKTCRVDAPPPQDFDKCDGQLTQCRVIWNGGDITIDGLANDAPNGEVTDGQAVTFFAPSGGDNDVFVDIDGAKTGQSRFHLSCSGPDFNDPSDCGKYAGDGKDKGEPTEYINDWTLKGFVDKEGLVLICNGGSNREFADECTFEALPQRSCDNSGKPQKLTFECTGEGCDGSDNGQSSDKATCLEDGSLSGPVTITASEKEDSNSDREYTVEPMYFDSLEPGDIFTVSYPGHDTLRSNSFILLESSSGTESGTESNTLHTSCSQPLEVGDQFGSLKLIGWDDYDDGVDVTYRYTVTNNGDPLDDVTVTDNLLGPIGGPVALATGLSAIFDRTESLSETTTNVGTASATMLTGGSYCTSPATSTDILTVTGTEPTYQESITLDKIEDKKIKWEAVESEQGRRDHR